MSKILISGGAGFIGSNLIGVLLKQGHVVHCVDNLYSGTEDNIEEFAKESRFKFIKMSIEEYAQFNNKAFSGYDQIYHLACPASPKAYQKDPIYTLKTNAEGIEAVCKIAKRCNAKLLFTSTSEVYGDPKEHPQTEEYYGYVNPVGPRSCYDVGKRFAESFLMNYKEQHKIDAKIVRIFNTYGPKMRPNDGRVVSNFIVAAINGKPLILNGGGKQSRSFCYVDDLVEGLILYMNKETEFDICNIGNDDERLIMEVADEVFANIDTFDGVSVGARVQRRPLPQDDPVKRRPCLKRIKSLGWKPKIDFGDGIARTAEYFKNLYGTD